MTTTVTDIQVVGETEGTLFEFLNNGTTNCLINLANTGTNTINYRFQEYTDGVWVDLVDAPDGELYATLMSGQQRSLALVSSNPKIRLVGNASGGSSLWFTVSRYVVRASGGQLPLLNF